MKNSSGTAAAVVRRAARVKYGRAALFRAVYLFLLFFFLSPLLPPAPTSAGRSRSSPRRRYKSRT